MVGTYFSSRPAVRQKNIVGSSIVLERSDGSKYVAGAKNPSAREAEIKRTARLYKEGKLTPAMMDRIAKQRMRG